jgi:hypothetical protein
MYQAVASGNAANLVLAASDNHNRRKENRPVSWPAVHFTALRIMGSQGPGGCGSSGVA